MPKKKRSEPSKPVEIQPHEYLSRNPASGGILYYPGAGTDSGPFHLFAGHAQYGTVVYADYVIERTAAVEFLTHLDGWQAGPVEELTPANFSEADWSAFWPEDEASRAFAAPERAFGLQTRLVNPGGRVVRFIYLATEGVTTFVQLLKADLAPTAMVLQDHGFGGNWTNFGENGELRRTADLTDCFPELLFVSDNTPVWTGYRKVSSPAVYPGQMHSHSRGLYHLEAGLATGRRLQEGTTTDSATTRGPKVSAARHRFSLTQQRVMTLLANAQLPEASRERIIHLITAGVLFPELDYHEWTALSQLRAEALKCSEIERSAMLAGAALNRARHFFSMAHVFALRREAAELGLERKLDPIQMAVFKECYAARELE